MNLQRVVRILESFAPTRLAEKWDNVGLLVEPSAGADHRVERLMLTNDLTEAVLDEGIERRVNMIVSYHPPIFSALKRLCGGGGGGGSMQDRTKSPVVATCAWKQRLIVRCVEHRIAIYSPHTAWDAVPAGVNNWLAKAFDCLNVDPITNCEDAQDGPLACKILGIHPFENIDNASVTKEQYCEMLDIIHNSEESKPYMLMQGKTDVLSFVTIPEEDATNLTDLLDRHNPGFNSFIFWTKTRSTAPTSGCGMGRICDLKESVSLDELVNSIKGHLNLPHVQLAVGRGVDDTKARYIRRVALCAGSGASVLGAADRRCDVYWTGKMSHHDVLDAVAKGISVVLCGHSNTERGFLVDFAPALRKILLDKIDVLVSTVDADPLVIV